MQAETTIRTSPDKARPPTVLQVLPRLVAGGAERGALEIAGALVATGGKAVIASAGGPMVAELEALGARHVELPLAERTPWRIWRNAARLSRVIVEENVDIVHARSRAPAWSAWQAARRTGRHFVTTFHARYGLGPPFKRLYNSVMARGVRVIAISEFIARHVMEEYGVPAERITVIPRGVDTARYDPSVLAPERVRKIRAQWGFEEDRPIVLLPGRLTRLKGQEVTIDAMARLEDSTAAAAIVGSDAGREAYRRELEERIAARGLASRVRLYPHCDDMPAAYQAARIVVSASIQPEGFGRVVTEGQALGRMVVASDHGGSLEQIEDGVTGFLFESGNAEALARRLDEVLALPREQREEISAAAMHAARSRYSTEAMCRSTLQLYREVMSA